MRKTMKRNIQKQRQQRSVTYMRSEQERKAQRKNDMQNAIGGLILGLVMGVGGFYAADHALEKRNAAIGASSHVEQSN